jgi:hypothetical protein
MAPYSGPVGWGGNFCALAIDDLDLESWTGTPIESIAFVSSGAPFPWRVRVVLLEGSRGGDAASADLFIDLEATDQSATSEVAEDSRGPQPSTSPRLSAAGYTRCSRTSRIQRNRAQHSSGFTG